METTQKLTKSSDDNVIAGVAGGLAQYFNVDSTLVRLLFVVFAMAGGPGLMVYILLWLIMPSDSRKRKYE